MSAAIEFRNVSKSFGDKQVLKNISLTIDEGSIAVILGPSGTGKSVLIRCLIGLLKPDADGGEIWVFGTNVAAIDESKRADRKKLYDVRKRFGMLFQDGALFDDMTVGENVAFPMRHHGGLRESEIQARVADKLARVGLKDAVNKMPSELSGGMRKRAAFARAIANEPSFVLCDEPSSGLDPVMAATLDELILEMHHELNIGFIVITHDTAEARMLGGRMGLLNKGELVVPFDATDKVLRSNHPAIRQFFDRQKSGPIQVV